MATIADYIEDAKQALLEDLKFLKEDSQYYEACAPIRGTQREITQKISDLSATVGWSRLYLDSLVARIRIDGFRLSSSSDPDEQLMDWWKLNDLELESQISFLETFIHGRCYITVSAPTAEDVLYGHPNDVPIIRVESPRCMWVDIDPRTKRVRWAVRFYREPHDSLKPEDEEQQYTIYLPNRTVIVAETKANQYRVVEDIEHNLGIVPIVPCLNRERVSDRLGRSEIIPELRSLQDVATRVVANMQTAAELMAVPQRLLFGVERDVLSQNTDATAQYKAYMANILAFENEQGSATQFSAAELSNYTGVLQELSRMAASYTGLPPQYLSFNSQNPSSAEAIRSAESRLVMYCEQKGAMFGKIWCQVMRLGKLVMTGSIPTEWQRLVADLADPATPTYAAKADAAMKLVAGKPIIPVEQARIDMGYTPEEREQMKVWDEEESAEYAASLMGVPSARFPLPTTSSNDDNTEEDTSQNP